MWYIFLNFFQMTFEDIFSCQIYADQKASDKCLANSLALKIFLGLIWTFVELYFCYIVYCFYVKTLKGYYGPMGFPPIFPDIYAASQNSMIRNGIIMEVKGMKLNGTNTLKEYIVPLGYPIQDKKYNKVFSYFRFFFNSYYFFMIFFKLFFLFQIYFLRQVL